MKKLSFSCLFGFTLLLFISCGKGVKKVANSLIIKSDNIPFITKPSKSLSKAKSLNELKKPYLYL